jgi:hypothetical protein
MYTGTKDERKSNSKSTMVNRLLVLLMITMSLVFSGGQSTPTALAGGGCDLVCGDPFIDPNDGQCYVMCCPQDKECMRPCETKLCQ